MFFLLVIYIFKEILFCRTGVTVRRPRPWLAGVRVGASGGSCPRPRRLTGESAWRGSGKQPALRVMRSRNPHR